MQRAKNHVKKVTGILAAMLLVLQTVPTTAVAEAALGLGVPGGDAPKIYVVDDGEAAGGVAAPGVEPIEADSDPGTLPQAGKSSPYCPVPRSDAGETLPAESDHEAPALSASASVPGLDSPVNAENALAILRAYDPDGYHMVNYNMQQGASSFAFWIDGSETNASGLDTAVHEECHGYTSNKGGIEYLNGKGFWIEAIYVGGGKDIRVSEATTVNVFPTSEMAKGIPGNLRTFRFETYVSEGSAVSANVDGPFGLLNEFNAYSWGLNNQLNLFDYYKLHGTSFDVWHSFANAGYNNRMAYAEFRYWTLRYLDYAKTNHREVYDFFLSNQNYIDAFCLTQERFENEIKKFDERIRQVVSLANADGRSARVENDMLWIDHTGTSVVDSDYYKLMNEIAKPQYQAIDQAIHAKQSTTKKSLAQAAVSNIADQTYTGRSIEPAVTVTLDGKVLRKGVDYDCTYTQNVNVGTAYVLIVGKGDYTGSKTVSFRIVGYPFIDVTSATPHLDDILWLSGQGISTGWNVGGGRKEFRPYANVARADMAAFLYRLSKSWGVANEDWKPSGKVSFIDVSNKTAHYDEIMWLAENGISQGWVVAGGRREFRPYANVARADMAAFLHRLAQRAGVKDPTRGEIVFSDVTNRTAHAEDISWLAATGVSKGWDVAGGRKEFRPYAFVARADMAAFLHRLDGLEKS